MRSGFSIFSSLFEVPSPDSSSEALGRDAEENREVYFSCTRSCWNNVFVIFRTVSTHFITICKSTQKSTLTLRPVSHLLLWPIVCRLVSRAQKVMFSRAQKHDFRSWKAPFRKTKSPSLGDMKKPRAEGSTRQRNLRASFVTLSPIFTLACTNGSGQEGCNADICTCCIHASGCRSSKARTVRRATACRICDSASWWEVTPSEFLFAW